MPTGDAIASYVDVGRWMEIGLEIGANSLSKVNKFVKTIPPYVKVILLILLILFTLLILYGVWVNRSEWQRCKNY